MLRVLFILLLSTPIQAVEFANWGLYTESTFSGEKCGVLVAHMLGMRSSVMNYHWIGERPPGDIWRAAMTTTKPPPPGSDMQLLSMENIDFLSPLFEPITDKFGLIKSMHTNAWQIVQSASESDRWLVNKSKKHFPPRELGRVELIQSHENANEVLYTEFGLGSKSKIPVHEGVESAVDNFKKGAHKDEGFSTIEVTHTHPRYEHAWWPKNSEVTGTTIHYALSKPDVEVGLDISKQYSDKLVVMRVVTFNNITYSLRFKNGKILSEETENLLKATRELRRLSEAED